MTTTQIIVIVMLTISALNTSLNVCSRHKTSEAWATPLALLLTWGWYALLVSLLWSGGFWP